MQDYDLFAETFSSSRKKMKWKEIDFLLEKVFALRTMRQGTLLDVGCGNGRLIDHLSAHQFSGDYLGVDASRGMVDAARELHPSKSFQVLDMVHLQSLEHTFDIICFIASFHHLSNEAARIDVLHAVRKLLRDDGVVIFTNWNLYSPENLEKYKDSYQGGGDFHIKIGEHSRYYHAFELGELERLFSQAGLAPYLHELSDTKRNILSLLRK